MHNNYRLKNIICFGSIVITRYGDTVRVGDLRDSGVLFHEALILGWR